MPDHHKKWGTKPHSRKRDAKKTWCQKEGIPNHNRKCEAKYQQKMGCQNTTGNGMANHNRKWDAKKQQKTGCQPTTEKWILNHNR